MQERSEPGRYFCEVCEDRYEQPGDCPKCTDEPLLDLADDDIVLMLESFDDAAKHKRYGVCFGVAFAITIAIVAVVVTLAVLVGLPVLPKLIFLLGFAVLAGSTTLLVMLFPARKKMPAGVFVGSVNAAPVPARQPPAIPSDRLGMCSACGTPINVSDAYVSEGGGALCETCFQQERVDRDMDAHGDEDFYDSSTGRLGKMALLGVAGAELLSDVREDLRDDRARRTEEDGEDDDDEGDAALGVAGGGPTGERSGSRRRTGD